MWQALKAKELGNVAYKNKDFETALQHYEEAVTHDPSNMTYISNQAGTPLMKQCHPVTTSVSQYLRGNLHPVMSAIWGGVGNGDAVQGGPV